MYSIGLNVSVTSVRIWEGRWCTIHYFTIRREVDQQDVALEMI